MMGRWWACANAASASTSAAEATCPVGLWGEISTIARVFGVIAAASAAVSTAHPVDLRARG